MATTITTTLYRVGSVDFTPAHYTHDGQDPRSWETLSAAAHRFIRATTPPEKCPRLERGDRRVLKKVLVRRYQEAHGYLPRRAERRAALLAGRLA